jgi:hypothetical protein
VQFLVIAGFDTKKLITLENKHWTATPQQPDVPVDDELHEYKVCYNNQHAFQKRNAPSRKRRKTSPVDEVSTTESVDAKNFVKLYAPAIRSWYLQKKRSVNSRSNRKNIYIIHDNCKAWTANITQNYFSNRDTFVPVYPSGAYYGFKNGFPANRF